MAAIRSGVLATVLVYVVGISAGVCLVDGRPTTRLGLALLWPLGPLACVVTLLLLLASLLIAASLRVVGR